MTTGHAQPGLRERKKLETRDALARAALELVAARGLAGVTVQDIADAAGVSPRTFFNYFASKDDALTQSPLDPETLTERLATVDPAAPALDALLAIMAPDIAALEASPQQWRLRFDVVAANPELLPRLVTVSRTNQQRIADALAARVAPVDAATDAASRLRVEILVAAVMAVLLHVMIAWHADGARGSLVAAIGSAIDTLRGELSPGADIVPREPAAPTEPTEPAAPTAATARGTSAAPTSPAASSARTA